MVNLTDNEMATAIQEAAMRAQVHARKAIVNFMTIEARAHPDGSGTITATAMTCGFLMSVIESSLVGLPCLSRKQFLSLAGDIFNDVIGNAKTEKEL